MSFGFGMGFPRSAPAAGGPSLNLQFAGSTTLDPSITFTRASTATYFDSTGTLTTAAINAPRFDYNPSTLEARGLLMEEPRTNSIRNNTMVGAVAGTPGTEPTNWASSSTGSGITRTIVGVGVENGITYVDYRFAGTPTAGTSVAIACELANSIAAVSGQTWTESVYVKLVGGSFTNTATTINLLGTDGTTGTESFSSATITSTPANLSQCRLSVTGTLAVAGTTNIQPRVRIGYTVSSPIDITLRIGMPQLEQVQGGIVVTSAAIVSGGSGYSIKDIISVVGGVGVSVASIIVTGVSVGGVITSVALGSVGNYTVVPTNPVSVTGGTGTLATFDLTSTFRAETASSVIPTSTAAITRAGDSAQIANISAWYNTSQSTLYAEFQGAATYSSTAGAVFSVVNAANSNNLRLIVHPSLASAATQNSLLGSINPGKINANLAYSGAVTKTAAAFTQNSRAISANGTTAATSAIADFPIPAENAFIGCGPLGIDPLNGWIKSIAYYPRRLSDAELQALTA